MYWITGILGLLLILAPLVLGYSDNGTALWTSIIIGAAVAVTSGIESLIRDVSNWEYWVVGILGILSFIAPWVLGFSAKATALWTSLVLGAAIAILAGIKVFTPGEQQ
jgi:uncharacterized membrane protein HdeD (DUF308 family)